MKVLVTAASKHGATAEIAQAIGDVLAGRDLDVTVAPVDRVAAVDGYDVIVAGSAVYAGHWLKPAKEFLERHADTLMERQVWLFSSGPLGDPALPEEDPVEAEWLVRETGAVEHHVFAGVLDRDRLSRTERAVARVVRAPYGDYRDWDDIRTWAAGLADRLSS
jgi:menaquinone-dependent protoporphyrinogen oxidase